MHMPSTLLVIAMRHLGKTHPAMSTKAYVALLDAPALDVLVQAPVEMRALWVEAAKALLLGAAWLDYGLDAADEAHLEALVLALNESH